MNELFQKAQTLYGKMEAKLLEHSQTAGELLKNLDKDIRAEIAEAVTHFGPNRKVQIKVKRLRAEAKLPAYAHNGERGDMAADIYAVEDYTIKPGEMYKAPTGLIMQPPPGYGFKIRERSSQWFNATTMVGAGLGDPGYAKEYFIGLKNLGSEPMVIKAGDRIAQVQVIERIEGVFEDNKDFAETERKGGLGSTGK